MRRRGCITPWTHFEEERQSTTPAGRTSYHPGSEEAAAPNAHACGNRQDNEFPAL